MSTVNDYAELTPANLSAHLNGERFKNNSSVVQGSSSAMTEIDIAKIVAQKYARNQPYEDRAAFTALVKEEFRNVFKVWSGLVKFIRTQTTGK